MTGPGGRTAQLLDHLTGARWFAGKGRRAGLAALTPLPWLQDPGRWPAVRVEVAEVTYPDGPGELYQLALSYRPEPQPGLEHAEVGRFDVPGLGPVVAYDAPQDPAAGRLLWRRLLDGDRYADGNARICFHRVAGEELATDLEPRPFTGQQSNTSVMYGDVAMLKLFRRLEVGRNLDIEVHEALSTTGTADVARLHGYVRAGWPGADGVVLAADLAMVVEKLADAEDGWGLALDSLRQGTDLTDRARSLGRALAETHGALRTAFPTDRVPGERVARVMADRLGAAIEVAPALQPYREGLRDRFAALVGRELDVQRVHGDFHLGQTLWTPGGWRIIDFEGEPVKSLAERAEPDSRWRDLAGMLRSFDYAAASEPSPGARAWADRCSAAFLEGYADGALGAADEAVLRAYLADKAVYEVVYETRNRPGWAAIPLAAVAALAAAPGDHGPTTPALAGG